MTFPHDDRTWADTAAFLAARLAPAERLIAPDPFRFALPRALRFGQLRNEPPGAFDWIVVHKGEVERIPNAFLRALPDAAAPVFANEVFVVFAAHPPADLLDLTESDHVRALAARLAALPAEPPPALGTVTAVQLPLREATVPVLRAAAAERPLRAPPATPPRPWLDPAALPGAAREAAFQAEVDRLVADYLGTAEGLAVLDIGCGGGRLAALLTGAREFVGVDVAEAPLARARARYPAMPDVALARMDAARLGFADGAFDAVAMLDLLDLLPDPPAALAEAARVLAPGGRLMVTATNRDSLPLRALRRLALPVPPGGVSVQELAGMLRAAGLAPTRMDGIMLPLGWATPEARSAFAPLEEDAEFVEAARLLGRSCGPEYALGIAMLATRR